MIGNIVEVQTQTIDLIQSNKKLFEKYKDLDIANNIKQLNKMLDTINLINDSVIAIARELRVCKSIENETSD